MHWFSSNALTMLWILSIPLSDAPAQIIQLRRQYKNLMQVRLDLLYQLTVKGFYGGMYFTYPAKGNALWAGVSQKCHTTYLPSQPSEWLGHCTPLRFEYVNQGGERINHCWCETEDLSAISYKYSIIRYLIRYLMRPWSPQTGTTSSGFCCIPWRSRCIPWRSPLNRVFMYSEYA
jgi:hypothetical protein